jgi:hypothetical protein
MPMIRIDLTAEETETLAAMLDNDLSDLRMEIAHTDRLEFRDRLRLKKAVLEKVLGSLEGAPTPV